MRTKWNFNRLDDAQKLSVRAFLFSQSEACWVFFSLISLHIAVGVIKMKFKVSYGLTFGKIRKEVRWDD